MVDTSLSLAEIHADWITVGNFKPHYRNTSVDIVSMLKYLGYMYYDTKAVDQLLRKYVPKKSERDIELLSYYQNQTKYEYGIRTQIKPGKLLKKLFPLVSDEQAEQFTNWYKNKYVLGISNLTYKVGNTAKDFKFAYTHNKTASGINGNFYDSGFKSISDSCMRDKFTSYRYHPSEAYASGDFEVHYLVDENNKVVARCTVCIKNKDGAAFVMAPIYAASYNAGVMLRDKLNQVKSTLGNVSVYGWFGAKIVKLLYRDPDCRRAYVDCIGPYLDKEGCLKHYDDNHFVLAYSSDLDYNYRFQSNGYIEMYKKWYDGKI